MEALAATIYAFCAINAKSVYLDKTENTRVCWDQMINCTIGPDGKIDDKQTKKCKQLYKELK